MDLQIDANLPYARYTRYIAPLKRISRLWSGKELKMDAIKKFSKCYHDDYIG